MPLLILVYFQTDAIQQVEDMIRSVLSMQVPIRKFINNKYFICKAAPCIKSCCLYQAKLGLFEMQKLFRSLKPAAGGAIAVWVVVKKCNPSGWKARLFVSLAALWIQITHHESNWINKERIVSLFLFVDLLAHAVDKKCRGALRRAGRRGGGLPWILHERGPHTIE